MDVPRGSLVAKLNPFRRTALGVALPALGFLVALGLAGASLAAFGADVTGIRRTLAITARFSYLWFWPAYAGSALAATMGRKFRLGRACGLAFVAAHSVHVLLVIWLYQIDPAVPLSLNDAIFFSVGAGFMYLLALLSIRSIANLLGASLWHFLLIVGMEYIEFAFLKDFWINPFHASLKTVVLYLPFMLLGLAGTLLRLSRVGVFTATVWHVVHQRRVTSQSRIF